VRVRATGQTKHATQTSHKQLKEGFRGDEQGLEPFWWPTMTRDRGTLPGKEERGKGAGKGARQGAGKGAGTGARAKNESRSQTTAIYSEWIRIFRICAQDNVQHYPFCPSFLIPPLSPYPLPSSRSLVACERAKQQLECNGNSFV